MKALITQNNGDQILVAIVCVVYDKISYLAVA